MAKKKRRARRFLIPEISLTPLIDTALTLLIIFMVTVPVVKNGIKVDLPQGNSKEVGEQQEFVVSLNKDGNLFFNSYPVSKKSLVEAVKKAMKDNDLTPVYVKADEKNSYGDVLAIVDELKTAGVQYVAMSMRAVV